MVCAINNFCTFFSFVFHPFSCYNKSLGPLLVLLFLRLCWCLWMFNNNFLGRPPHCLPSFASSLETLPLSWARVFVPYVNAYLSNGLRSTFWWHFICSKNVLFVFEKKKIQRKSKLRRQCLPCCPVATLPPAGRKFWSCPLHISQCRLCPGQHTWSSHAGNPSARALPSHFLPSLWAGIAASRCCCDDDIGRWPNKCRWSVARKLPMHHQWMQQWPTE